MRKSSKSEDSKSKSKLPALLCSFSPTFSVASNLVVWFQTPGRKSRRSGGLSGGCAKRWQVVPDTRLHRGYIFWFILNAGSGGTLERALDYGRSIFPFGAKFLSKIKSNYWPSLWEKFSKQPKVLLGKNTIGSNVAARFWLFYNPTRSGMFIFPA